LALEIASLDRGGVLLANNVAVFLLFAVFAEPPERRSFLEINSTLGFFAIIGDPTCCDVSFFFLVPFKDVTLSMLLVDAVIQMDPTPKWSRNQSFFLDDKAVKDGFRSSAS
jgi:hypothetical protein